MALTALQRDDGILNVFRQLFSIPNEAAWPVGLQNVTWQHCRRQTMLPLRLGGCGLRNSVRTSHAAYWASWADTLAVLQSRFPAIALRMLNMLSAPAPIAVGKNCSVPHDFQNHLSL